jgi:cyclic beta-1,2-glucan synthetase
MPQNTHLELITEEAAPSPETVDLEVLRKHAAQLARDVRWIPGTFESGHFAERVRALDRALRPVLKPLRAPRPEGTLSDDFRWLHDHGKLLHTELRTSRETLKDVRRIPHVRADGGATVPRVIAIAEGFLAATDYQFSEPAFAAYLQAYQDVMVLKMGELWALVPTLKLVLLERVAERGPAVLKDPLMGNGVGLCVRSLQEVGQTSWKDVLEPLIVCDKILRGDPTAAYARMDYESRDWYRNQVVGIAEHSDCSEVEVASEAIALARAANEQRHASERLAERRSHVGYYLVADGAPLLHRKTSYRAPFGERVQMFLRRYPDSFYVPGIEILTLVILLGMLLPVVDVYSSVPLILFSIAVLLLPCSQAAVELMNYLGTSILTPRILPKLDFTHGMPEDCVTLVAVPSLLLNEKQVRRLVEDLEVRFLGNHDRNMHFALLSDLPDSREPPREDDPLVDLCARLINELNEKYAGRDMGSFLLLHRHRIYNPRERVWMGWERKRGKLLDLNKLLRSQYDSFPVKVGDTSVLPRIRFVVTLDADTELPRGSAQRMVGALAHPLNQAIVDPERNIVVAGYGILQPRVGVSVQSAASSRLAQIYSGQTGFDIYTRAVSNVYQDLYGEGIFAGKGIYEVDTVHRVLDRRFPRNALLSHDLIEGAYARAGLASDIEVIEDYPSHYSAYNRRKHRWLRGDWQIAGWLRSWVCDESGRRAPNPISIVSRWKIFDNLRRSLVEPATFLLLLLGWLVLPGRPRYWTVATLLLLFLPVWSQFVFTLLRAAFEWNRQIARDALDGLFDANVNVLLTLTFLAHQTLLSVDAVVRALVRRTVTRRRLLEWETAAEAELGARRRTPIDTYLDLMPVLALGVGAVLWYLHYQGFWPALPILLLWAGSKPVSMWLNRPPVPLRRDVSGKDELFLRRAALRTWRYFAELCTQEHNWLIPDNVQEEPPAVAARLSPTNLAFLLNARQVACELGYLGVPELADLTRRTLATTSRLQKHRGHLYNWYDTRTLEPLPPRFVSSVDSGNLVAGLWTLQRGLLSALNQPLVRRSASEGLLDHLRTLVNFRAFPRRRFRRIQQQMKKTSWLQHLLQFPEGVFGELPPRLAASSRAAEAKWFLEQAEARVRAIRDAVRLHAPWLLPEFSALRNDPAMNLKSSFDGLALGRMPEFIDALTVRLQLALLHSTPTAAQKELYERLQALLPEARAHAVKLSCDLRACAREAGALADATDFKFLLNKRRKLLSAGYDADAQKLHSACYDLLASESRTAVFVAIAKEDIPQESWFLLGRAHTLHEGRPVLLSWTGTMFEYLMPALWMRTHPNTLLDRSRATAVQAQQDYTENKRAPWGISESAYLETDQAGNYQYFAFGLPKLALRKGATDALVISPYSTFLALTVAPAAALHNLRRMASLGWIGVHGFYESADFSRARRKWLRRYQLVRCWMAHHQGMSLLAVANFLQDGIVQEWFHSDPRVMATELLLHEKPVAHVRAAEAGFESAAA